MNGQYFANSFDTDDQNAKVSDAPAVNPDRFTDFVPENTDIIHAMPMVEIDAPIDLVNEPLAYEIPMGETPVEVDMVAETIVRDIPMESPINHDAPIGANAAQVAPLLHEDTEHFRTRWNEIQGMFVDEPRVAVQQADALVTEVIEQITRKFASEHSSLEGQWNQGNDVSTEDLRKVLQSYRSFFNRLVV